MIAWTQLLPFAVIISLSYSKSVVRLEPNITVRQTNGVQLAREGLGEVYGTRSCGGPGKIVQWRVEDCLTTKSPCRFPVDDTPRNGELEFIPSAYIKQLGFRLVYKYKDGVSQNVFDKVVEDSSVVAGVQHIVAIAGQVRRDLKGKKVKIQEIIYRLDNGKTEVCAEAMFHMV